MFVVHELADGFLGFLYLTDGESQMLDFQKAVVEDIQVRERLKSYGGKPVQEVLDRVDKLGKNYSSNFSEFTLIT